VNVVRNGDEFTRSESRCSLKLEAAWRLERPHNLMQCKTQ